MPLLEVREISVQFPIRSNLFRRPTTAVRAVDHATFEIDSGQTMGLIGESGCGKTSLGRAVIRLIEPASGSVWFEGEEITQLKRTALRPHRRKFQMIFQDPHTSLNPLMTVEEIIGEALEVHRLVATRADRRERVKALLEDVGLEAAHRSRYPHEFSGGQRQRIGIARALAVQPRLIVCDEPVSALDVSVQAQIINLFSDLQRSRGIAYLFIAHDLAVVEHISQRIMVMYLGKLIEVGNTTLICGSPRHPYTQALMSATIGVDPDSNRRRILLPGEPPSPISPPTGCPFHPRCPIAKDRCRSITPALRQVGEDHRVACHLA